MWEIIGYEEQKNEEGQLTGITIYSVKPYRKDQGVGSRSRRDWYRPSEIEYRPKVGDKVFIETEVRGKYTIVMDIYQ